MSVLGRILWQCLDTSALPGARHNASLTMQAPYLAPTAFLAIPWLRRYNAHCIVFLWNFPAFPLIP